MMSKQSVLFIKNRRPLSRRDAYIFIGISLGAFVGFAASFFLLRALPYPQAFPEVCIDKLVKRILSSVHAVVAFAVSLVFLVRFMSVNTFLKALGFTLGYFVFVISFLPLEDGYKEYIKQGMHHVLVLVVFLGYTQAYPRVTARCLLAEIVAPFLCSSWYLLRIGRTDMLLFKVLGVLTLWVWFVVRVINFTDIYLKSYRADVPRLAFWIFSPVLLLNYYWFFLFLKKAYETFIG